jgi:hypothetical protein
MGQEVQDNYDWVSSVNFALYSSALVLLPRIFNKDELTLFYGTPEQIEAGFSKAILKPTE